MSYRIVTTLDDLKKQRRSILQVLREQLQQVSVVVEVDENTQLLKLKHHDIATEKIGSRKALINNLRPKSTASLHRRTRDAFAIAGFFVYKINSFNFRSCS